MTTESTLGGRGLTEDQRARLQRRTVLTLMITQVVGGIGMGSMLAVGALIARDLTGSDTWSGMATTMITLGAAVFALPLASIATRRGRRPGLALGWAMGGVGSSVVIAATVMEWFVPFLVGMVLIGAGTATNLQARHAAADLAGEGTRGRDLSVVVWATTVGAVLGPNLIGVGGRVAALVGLPELLGPVLFTTAGFALGAALTLVLLRPDPLLASAARVDAPGAGPSTAVPTRRSPLSGLPEVTGNPRALLAIVGIVASHTVMVAVMTMTPVHMSHHGVALTVVGLTLSLHIAGMYAFSPLVGWLTDRLGRVPVLLAGQGVLLTAVAVAGTAGDDEARVTLGLVLLGLGWSFGLVSGSTLLAESVPDAVRPRVQGLSDLLMNLGGASAGAMSGVVLTQAGFGGLNLFAALFTLPVVVLAVRALVAGRGGDAGTS
ncbi:MFS transporter [Nocardiopsis lucentensis]|uniref:MFS transporter n=1 Tax=Nocardiopsis lucentensis TaxID=53441 RepID=UPI0003450034|nr:MFS transporter [Nocardiopsis lucentensis]